MVDSNMSGPDSQRDDWKPCPAGLLVKAACGVRSSVSRRQALRAGGSAAAVMLAGGLGWKIWSSREEAATVAGGNGHNCHKVESLLPRFLKGDLDSDTCHEIEAHLARCTHCTESWRKLRDSHA